MVPGRKHRLMSPYDSSRQMLKDYVPRERLRGFASKQAVRYPSGTLWPHGEFSYGYGKERADGGQWHEDPFVGMGVDDTEAAHQRARAVLPFDLSDVPNSCKWPRRGTKGMSGFGAQMVKAAGHLLQTLWPQHRKTLGTVTLPPMSDEARREVVEKWPLLTRELLTWLSRRLARQGMPKAVCCVTEIQPKRLSASQEGYLHWHLLWLNRPAKSGHWSVAPTDLSSWLDSLLRRHCPSYAGGHVNVDTRKVEGVVAAYMAKYMSKGRQMVAEAMEDWGHGLCPRTWWNMTGPLRKAVKANTARGREAGALLETIVQYALDGDPEECFAFLRPVKVDFDGVEVLMGWRGRFQPGLDKEPRSMLGFGDIAEPE